MAGAAQLGFGKFRGASGFEDTGETLEGIANTVIQNNTAVKKADGKDVAKQMKTFYLGMKR